jgi:hypothetical protein
VKLVVAFLLGAIAMVAIQGKTADDWLVVSGISYHLQRNGQNERNWGLGWERRLSENWNLSVGAYDNSSNRLSVYGAAGYTPYRCWIAKCGVITGLVTGYEQDQKPTVLGGFAATVEGRDMGFNFIFIPAAGGVNFLQVKFRW